MLSPWGLLSLAVGLPAGDEPGLRPSDPLTQWPPSLKVAEVHEALNPAAVKQATAPPQTCGVGREGALP